MAAKTQNKGSKKANPAPASELIAAGRCLDDLYRTYRAARSEFARERYNGAVAVLRAMRYTVTLQDGVHEVRADADAAESR